MIRSRPTPRAADPRASIACRECGASTNGRKPYCVAHVLHSPYARRVYEAYERALLDRARGRVNVHGLIAQDILVALQQAPCTVGRLRSDIGLSGDEVRAYLAALERCGMIEIERVRGSQSMLVWLAA